MNYDKLMTLIMALFDILVLTANRRKSFYGGEELIKQNTSMSEKKDILTKNLWKKSFERPCCSDELWPDATKDLRLMGKFRTKCVHPHICISLTFDKSVHTRIIDIYIYIYIYIYIKHRILLEKFTKVCIL